MIARNYRRRLTLAEVARAVSCSPRQVQRAYEQFGELSFHEDLRARRMSAAAQLLAEQPAIAVADVARLVGYRQPAHFAQAFRRGFGVAPASFRQRARRYRAQRGADSVSRRAAPPSRRRRPRSSAARRGSGAASSAIVSAPASRMRISVPPPGARSADTEPPCCSTT